MVGWQLSASHDSSTVFDKYREFLTSDLQEQLADELKGCHGFSIAVDEKETEMACVIHFVSANSNLCSRLLTYISLSPSLSLSLSLSPKYSYLGSICYLVLFGVAALL